jgi:hypothetical protein
VRVKGSRVGHAHVSGTVAHHAPEHTGDGVTYNPHKHSTFVTRSDGKPIHKAKTVHMTRVAVPGVAHGHRPRVSVEHASSDLRKGDVVSFPGVKIPGKKQDLGANAQVIPFKQPLPKDAGTPVWGPVKTGQVRTRQYRCTACGNVQDFSTNHDGNVIGYCDHRLAKKPGQGCSWKGWSHPETGEWLEAGHSPNRVFTRDVSNEREDYAAKDAEFAKLKADDAFPSKTCSNCESGCCKRDWHHSGDVCLHCGMDER